MIEMRNVRCDSSAGIAYATIDPYLVAAPLNIFRFSLNHRFLCVSLSIVSMRQESKVYICHISCFHPLERQMLLLKKKEKAKIFFLQRRI